MRFVAVCALLLSLGCSGDKTATADPVAPHHKELAATSEPSAEKVTPDETGTNAVGTEPTGTKPTAEVTPSTDTDARLDGAPWKVIENVFWDKTVEFPGKLTFKAEQLRVDAPCNFYTTRFTSKGNTITIFPFGNMPKTCGVEAMEAEGALLRAMMRVSQFQISGNTLTLKSVDGRQMLKAKRLRSK